MVGSASAVQCEINAKLHHWGATSVSSQNSQMAAVKTCHSVTYFLYCIDELVHAARHNWITFSKQLQLCCAHVLDWNGLKSYLCNFSRACYIAHMKMFWWCLKTLPKNVPSCFSGTYIVWFKWNSMKLTLHTNWAIYFNSQLVVINDTLAILSSILVTLLKWFKKGCNWALQPSWFVVADCNE